SGSWKQDVEYKERKRKIKKTYIGAHYRSEVGTTLWDDGTVPRSDTPFGSPKDDPKFNFGRLEKRDADQIVMILGEVHRGGLCGNQTNVRLRRSFGVWERWIHHLKNFKNFRNFTSHESFCKDIGYDGLAVLSSPEAFEYAIKITQNNRKKTYIGAHYRSEVGTTLWDDGTVPRSDTPFGSPKDDPKFNFGRLEKRDADQIVMILGEVHRGGLCGNHKNYPTESRGTTMRGELLTTEKTVVSVSQVFSYVECAVLCGMVHECRAGEFNSDLLTCTVIGEYQSSGHIPKSEIVTFIRQTF
ncbi:hypothetical protein RRG08_033372, partial [Elysia crispata]